MNKRDSIHDKESFLVSKNVVELTDVINRFHQDGYIKTAVLVHDWPVLPEVDKEYNSSEILGSVESIKAVSDIYSPLKGKINKINEELITKPELINISPYNDGWIAELESDNLEKDLSELINNKQYSKYLNDTIK